MKNEDNVVDNIDFKTRMKCHSLKYFLGVKNK